ncbi:MAG: ABC transporter ATP-binding protein [Beijerinckiaceae bacterium]
MLELAGVNAYYGQSHILHDIKLSVQQGERIAVLGRNGSGKTTLLKSIMNAGPTVQGSIHFRSRDLAGLQANQRARLGLALVPEDRRIFGHLTSVENLEISQYAACKDREAISADELLGRFPMLAPLRDRLGSQMSGGQQQMLAVARGIAARPYLMLLDEPTEGLAPLIVSELATEVVSCCERYDVGLILAEQSIWFARQCTGRVIVVDAGRIAFAGSWSEFDDASARIQRHLAL